MLERNHVGVVCSLSMLAASLAVLPPRAQAQDQDPTLYGGTGQVTTTQDGFTLTLISNHSRLSAQAALKLQTTFFATIKPESDYFAPDCPHIVRMTIQPAIADCGGPAGACAWTDEVDPNVAYILVDGDYIVDHSEGTDVVAHEAMHVVQDPQLEFYATCSHWFEGQADLARAWWGLDNDAAGWALSAPTATESYTDGYVATAGFLSWIYETFGDEPILRLDRALRANQCPEPDFWRQDTGYESIDALWAAYVYASGAKGGP